MNEIAIFLTLSYVTGFSSCLSVSWSNDCFTMISEFFTFSISVLYLIPLSKNFFIVKCRFKTSGKLSELLDSVQNSWKVQALRRVSVIIKQTKTETELCKT